MKLESALSSYFKYAGLIMASIFAVAIVMGVAGFDYSELFAKLGIFSAIIIPITGLFIMLVIFLKNGETKSGLIVIILLIFLVATVIWRLYV